MYFVIVKASEKVDIGVSEQHTPAQYGSTVVCNNPDSEALHRNLGQAIQRLKTVLLWRVNSKKEDLAFSAENDSASME